MDIHVLELIWCGLMNILDSAEVRWLFTKGGCMKKLYFIILVALFVAAFYPGTGLAGPDMYSGDTSMFGGSPVVLAPNVLIILDNSGSMGGTVPGGKYDPDFPYDVTNHCDNGSGISNQPCTSTAVYSSKVFFLADVNSVAADCQGGHPRNALITTGESLNIRLQTSGACRTTGSRDYQMGNFINWQYGPGADKRKIDIAKDVVTHLVNATNGVNFGLMVYHYPTNDYSSAAGAQGSQFMSAPAYGSTYVTTAKNMDTIFTGTITNRQALVSVVHTLEPTGYTPLGESLVEALRYFKGQPSDFGNTIGVTSGSYTSPITWGCQKNYIIFVSDGEATADDSTKLDFINTTYGRYDGGNCSNPPYTTCASNRQHSMAGAAKYLYEQDLSSGFTGSQNVTTYTIGFGFNTGTPSATEITAMDLLKLTADSTHGRGKYFDAGSETELTTALTSVMAEIFAVNTSYVAPVVPVSPENKTSSGSRIYMGFFKPLSGQAWLGNLKKYGIDLTTTKVLDKNGNAATGSDGMFLTTASSYWSSVNDAGDVDQGGVGERLVQRNFTTNPRKLYTYKTGNPTTLTSAANAFNSTNITPIMLYTDGTGSVNAPKLVQFINGIDAFDDNANGNTLENREWIMGDILHAKPVVVHYQPFTAAQESTSTNKSMIYVGANDGMLHAFQDRDGEEAWAFIPPDLIPKLRYLHYGAGVDHAYFVDSSPTVYKYDKNNDGTINPADGDMVILMFGERRGGGSDSYPSTGYYYALDVSDPLNPKYLWSINGDATGEYPQLAETWSEPKIVKIKSESGVSMVAAVIGAGYDNMNEDSRYGNMQLFTGSVPLNPLDIGNLTGAAGNSLGIGNPAYNTQARGRGIYVVEIARLDSAGVPSIATATSGKKVWGFSTASLSNYSIPSEVAALDTDGNEFADRLYVGDTGGNVWRFDIGSAPWTGKPILNLNNASDKGRKIFYKPSVYSDATGTARLMIGTGDREHPLNQNVVDRLYGLRDRGQTTVVTEAAMYDATLDILQLGTTDATAIDTIMTTLNNSYGWFIKLDQSIGEKSLAYPTLFNGVGYFTTYAPTTTAVVDPCSTGNLGTGALYALNSVTGEAVVNYYAANDSDYTSLYSSNQRATAYGGIVLQRVDRKMALPPGIPSGLVLVMDSSGKLGGFVGVGGALTTAPVSQGGAKYYPSYWRTW